ncbi:TetR/AcrR family transcriptional regulator [Qipengyuania oceanensis]|uniref:Tetracyclin repressor-like C-terminal domain-containing protein n=1 Tax=Qipengyuania oceanensis TaxID=1463597 RepID=A0A844YDY2_9SPHN|nr:TetR/AcrR family transcriptional regulator [Qipengyuania oceanensis]MXO63296.1 hypothetical protein [Qipengyuania oceanensis]
MTGEAEDRHALVKAAMQAIERRGEAVSRATLASESGIARARIERIFPEEEDLFDAVVEQWFAPHIAIMEEVLASDLPITRKVYEFFARRFKVQRDRYLRDPSAFATYCDLGGTHFERVRSYVDLADHYTCELIAQAQAEGHFPGLEIDEALSLINQMVTPYTMPDVLLYMEERLTEAKLARIVETIFAGLSGEDRGSAGVAGLRTAP